MAIESSDSPVLAGEAGATKGLSLLTLSIAALVVLVIGLVGGGWGMSRLLADDGAPAQTKVIDVSGRAGTPAAPAQVAAPTLAGAPQRVAGPPVGADALAARVVELEQRLSLITLQAESASGNVSRAEGLIVVFAVRRALDRALPLGDLDAQLRLRFGDNQPKAVETIIDTARDPVTLEQLYAGLDALRPQLSGRGAGSGGLWTGFRRELSELFVIRAAETPSQRAFERFERARRYLAGGQVDKAIEEVQAMPGAAAANDWLIDARRYHEARRALDLIETAALVEPGGSPAAAATGAQPAATTR